MKVVQVQEVAKSAHKCLLYIDVKIILFSVIICGWHELGISSVRCVNSRSSMWQDITLDSYSPRALSVLTMYISCGKARSFDCYEILKMC
jgi:hypothetical protein